MSSQLKQTLVMIQASLFSLPRRLTISASMVLSVALVVCVLAGFLSMSKGFEKALNGAGSPSVAVILGGGTNQETGSDIPADTIRSIEAMTGDIGVARDASGAMISSREVVVPVDFRQTAGGTQRTLALRGMDVSGPAIRDGIAMSETGAFSRPAPARSWWENVLPRSFRASRSATRSGSARSIGPWQDIFPPMAARSSPKSGPILMPCAPRSIGRVRSRASDCALSGRLHSRRYRTSSSTAATTPLVILSEADLYAAQSGRTASLIRLFGWPLALLMALGAGAGALNTMMSSVSDRKVEIATVRALGFSRLSAFIATWVEGMTLAAAGAVLGIADIVASLQRNGRRAPSARTTLGWHSS